MLVASPSVCSNEGNINGGMSDAALLLGLFAHGPFDEEVFAALAAALLSLSDAVRSDAMTAITYSEWSEFGPFLRAGLQEVMHLLNCNKRAGSI